MKNHLRKLMKRIKYNGLILVDLYNKHLHYILFKKKFDNIS